MLRKGRSKNEEWSATNRGNSKKQYTRKDNKNKGGYQYLLIVQSKIREILFPSDILTFFEIGSHIPCSICTQTFFFLPSSSVIPQFSQKQLLLFYAALSYSSAVTNQDRSGYDFQTHQAKYKGYVHTSHWRKKGKTEKHWSKNYKFL